MRNSDGFYLNGNNSTVQVTLAHDTSKTFSYNGNDVLLTSKMMLWLTLHNSLKYTGSV